ncbi:hypothetical protein B0H15DRAFT_543816 [Mycena belliarum]|uniref:DUF6699 domain-containing protein n=1 Tax=Mycena belliarum TaxID=1033014 RepID=A0AAD6XZJ4_9AGAR|nr:hypothetical protein B0H15DRAFT_543816 [Mycena belliae]
MYRQRRSRRLPTPRSVPQYAGTGFVNPIRSAFFPGMPSFDPFPRVPPVPTGPNADLNTPSAMGWRQVGAQLMMPQTPANTPAWPQIPAPPLQDGVAALPADTLHWTPGTFPPLPFGTPVPFHVHPSLIPNPINPTIPQLQWDVLHAPEQARLYTGRGILKKPNLKDTVVFPVADKIWVCADAENCALLAYWMQLWGPIIIEPGRSVKIVDLLDAVHKYFMVPLSAADFRVIRRSRSPVNPSPLTPLMHAALRRAEDSYELRGIATKEFRRIDVLGAFRQWGGVRPMLFQDGTWKLFLNLLPYSVPRVA